MNAPKIDKTHGFMQSIIKNQVLRDEYDKEQKLLTCAKKNEESLKSERLSGPVETESKRNRAEKRAPKELYVPPHLKKRAVQEQLAAPKTTRTDVKEEFKHLQRRMSQREESRVLFKFEYEDDNGEVKSILVREGDNAEDLAETFGNQLGLTKSLRKALKRKLEMEIMSCYDS